MALMLYSALVIAAALAADVELAASAENAVPHGSWRHLLSRDDAQIPCWPGREKKCVTYELRIENSSTDTLECKAHLQYHGKNRNGKSTLSAVRVMLPKQSRPVIDDLAIPDVTVKEASATCEVRPPRPKLETPKECRFEILTSQSPMDFYPANSILNEDQGPVDVEFSLEQPEGSASQLRVVGSSLHTKLDEAGLKFVKNQRFGTACPGSRHRLKVMFELRE